MSDGVEAALHCAMVLAGLPEEALLSSRALAAFHEVSESYLLKHLQALSRAGLVRTVKGPQGGYRLGRPPGDISLLDVVTAIDGPAPAFQCRNLRKRGPGALDDPCAYRVPCVIHRRMLAAEDAWRASLAGETLADLVSDLRSDADPRLLEKGIMWLRDHVHRPS